MGAGSTLPSSKTKNKKTLSFVSFAFGLSSWEGSCVLGRVWKPAGGRCEDCGFRAGRAWVGPCLDQGHFLLLTSF